MDVEGKNLWEENHVRRFISHKDEYRKEVSVFASSLKEYGIDSFVAHEDIKINMQGSIGAASSLSS